MKKVDHTVRERMQRYRENQKKKNIRKISLYAHNDDVLRIKAYAAQLKSARKELGDKDGAETLQSKDDR